MYPLKEVPRYYVADINENGSEKIKIILPLIFRSLIGVEVGEEIIVFYDENSDSICVKKAFPHCSDCDTLGEEEKIVEIYKNLYFCEKCLNNRMMKTFGGGLSH